MNELKTCHKHGSYLTEVALFTSVELRCEECESEASLAGELRDAQVTPTEVSIAELSLHYHEFLMHVYEVENENKVGYVGASFWDIFYSNLDIRLVLGVDEP